MAQAEIDTSTRSAIGQRSPLGASRFPSKGGERLAYPAHLRLAAASHAQVEFSREASMQAPINCGQCDLPEERCTCERYCTICKGQHNVRLCSDGLYYCPDCREACDVSLAGRGT